MTRITGSKLARELRTALGIDVIVENERTFGCDASVSIAKDWSVQIESGGNFVLNFWSERDQSSRQFGPWIGYKTIAALVDGIRLNVPGMKLIGRFAAAAKGFIGEVNGFADLGLSESQFNRVAGTKKWLFGRDTGTGREIWVEIVLDQKNPKFDIQIGSGQIRVWRFADVKQAAAFFVGAVKTAELFE